MMGDRQWPDPRGWEALTQQDATDAHKRRPLPLCTPDELREELAAVEADLELLADVFPVSPDAEERKREREATLLAWRDRLLEQLAADEGP